MRRGGILLCALLPAIAAAQAVRVRVASLAAAEPCRADRALSSQLRGIPGVELIEQESDFEAVLLRDAATWQVSLRRPDGSVALQRTLSGAKECADVSFAATLVIERFIRALDLKVELPGIRSRAAASRPDAGSAAAADRNRAATDQPSASQGNRATAGADARGNPSDLSRAGAIEPSGGDAGRADAGGSDAGTATRSAEADGSPTDRSRAAAPDAGLPKLIDAGPSVPDAGTPDVPPDAVVAAIGRTREAPPPSQAPEEPARRTPPIFTRVEVSAGAGLWLNDLTFVRPAFEASAGVFIWKRLRIAAQFALSSTETVVIPGDATTNRGELTTQPFLGALNVGLCASPGVFRICGSAVGGAHIESASTRGAFVFNDQTRWLARPTFGLDLQLGWLPVRALVVSLSGTALYTPGTTTWSLEGLEADFGKSFPHFEGLIRITIGFGADR